MTTFSKSIALVAVVGASLLAPTFADHDGDDKDHHDRGDAWIGGLIRLVFYLFIAIAVVIFAFYEKRHRWTQRSMANMWPSSVRRNGRFRVGLCGCCSRASVCCKVCCCAPVMSTFNRAELEQRQWQCSDLLCMEASLAYWNRQTIRHKLDVEPNNCEDVCVSCCCYPCIVGQQTMEIEQGFGNTGTEIQMSTGPMRDYDNVPIATAVNYA